MKRLVLFLAVSVLICSSALAQVSAKGSASAQGGAKAEAQNANQTVILDSGAQLSAELLATLEAGKAKPGDEFKMRTLKPVIVGGKEVIAKGSVLTGHVVESARAEGKEGVSRLKLGFDQLRNKNLTMPFSATIEQITQVSINSQNQIDDLGASSGSGAKAGGAAGSRASASGRSNGGLLGGVTGTVNNTVGGVVGATTGAVGGVVDTTGQVTGQVTGRVIATSSQTVNGAAATAKGLIAITSTSSAETGGSSTLSLTGKNMKIEEGSVFSLRTDKSLNINESRASRAPNR
jgi:hypothetical protein